MERNASGGTPGDDVFGLRWWNRISFRLGTAIVVVTAAVFTAIAWFTSFEVNRLFESQHLDHARRTATVIADDLSTRMIDAKHDVWGPILREEKKIAKTAGASRISIVGVSSGIVRASTDSALQGAAIDIAREARCPGCAHALLTDFPRSSFIDDAGGSRMLRVVSPIPAKPQCARCHGVGRQLLGMVMIDFDLTPLKEEVQGRARAIAVTGLVFGAALLLAVAALFRRLVLRPIRAVENAAGALAGGNLRARAAVTDQNELGQLGEHFNRMAQRIEDQIEDLEASNLELDLLYTLVTEVSRNLEISEMASTVVNVLDRKLRPVFIAFCVQTAADRWACALGREAPLVRGEGHVTAALDGARGATVAANFPRRLIDAALAEAKPQFLEHGTAVRFVVPVKSEDQLLGLLACDTGPLTARIGKELFVNLCAHLTLAAENSRNYVGAITDPMTGLRNKRYGLARLVETVDGARRYGTSAAVLMLDIDRFKDVNDAYGHPVGDDVLKEVSGRVSRCTRKSDIAVRFGGEEFLVILPNTGFDELRIVAEKIRSEVAKSPVIVDEVPVAIPVTVSVGGATFGDAADTADALISAADQALYRAKQAGRNRVELFTPGTP